MLLQRARLLGIVAPSMDNAGPEKKFSTQDKYRATETEARTRMAFPQLELNRAIHRQGPS